MERFFMENIPLETGKCCSLFSRVCLEGVIEQCVAVSEGGKTAVLAVDMSNSVFVSALADLGIPDSVLGIGNLSSVVRILSQGGEFLITTTEGALILKKKGYGSVRFTLMKPEEIPTSVSDDTAGSQILSKCKTCFILEREDSEKIQFFASVLPSSVIQVTGSKGRISFASPTTELNRFSTGAGSFEGKDFANRVFGSFLLKALKEAFSSAEVKQVEIRTGDKLPLIVCLDSENFWAITPIM